MRVLPGKKRWVSLVLFLCALVVIGHVFFLSYSDLKKYPGLDLRAKVVGARRLVRGLDPYYDPYLESPPEQLRMRAINTYSPALLTLYIPLSNLTWHQQRIAYFAFDWIAVLLCFALLARVFPAGAPKATLFLLFTILIVGDFSFRIHLERGQYYVGLTLLMVLAAVFIHRRRESWIHAAPLALLILLRPTYIITVVGLYLWKRRAYALRTAFVLCALLALLLPLTGLKAWQNYASAIRRIQKEALLSLNGVLPSDQTHPYAPSVFEGVDFSKGMDLHAYQADRSFIGVLNGSPGPALTSPVVNRLGLRNPRLVARLNTAGLLSMGAFGLMVMFGLSRCPQSSLIPIAFAFLMPMNLELFSPQRYAYGDVTVLVPLLLILATVLGKRNVVGPVMVATLMVFASALPWLALHYNSHVPVSSFVKYAVTLLILNVYCVREAWMAWAGASSQAAPATQVGSLSPEVV